MAEGILIWICIIWLCVLIGTVREIWGRAERESTGNYLGCRCAQCLKRDNQ